MQNGVISFFVGSRQLGILPGRGRILLARRQLGQYREELFLLGNPRVQLSKKEGGSDASKLRNGSLAQVARG